jgi:Uma2 family endonuclease
MADSVPGRESDMALETEPLIRRRRFSVDEYHRLGETGIIGPDERVELIEGEIIEMSPIGKDHASVVDRLTMLFVTRVAGRAHVRVQGPVTLRDLASEPQPDLLLLRPQADYYRSGHPGAPHVLLAIEVMESSVAYDRRRKLPLYARAGFPEVWLVDVNVDVTSVYRDPTPAGYRQERTVRRDDPIAPLALPDLALHGRDLTG